MFLRRN